MRIQCNYSIRQTPIVLLRTYSNGKRLRLKYVTILLCQILASHFL